MTTWLGSVPKLRQNKKLLTRADARRCPGTNWKSFLVQVCFSSLIVFYEVLSVYPQWSQQALKSHILINLIKHEFHLVFYIPYIRSKSPFVSIILYALYRVFYGFVYHALKRGMRTSPYISTIIQSIHTLAHERAKMMSIQEHGVSRHRRTL